jgi:hypothetical protein
LRSAGRLRQPRARLRATGRTGACQLGQQVDGKPLGGSAGKAAGEIDADQLGWREFFLDPACSR